MTHLPAKECPGLQKLERARTIPPLETSEGAHPPEPLTLGFEPPEHETIISVVLSLRAVALCSGSPGKLTQQVAVLTCQRSKLGRSEGDAWPGIPQPKVEAQAEEPGRRGPPSGLLSESVGSSKDPGEILPSPELSSLCRTVLFPDTGNSSPDLSTVVSLTPQVGEVGD